MSNSGSLYWAVSLTATSPGTSQGFAGCTTDAAGNVLVTGAFRNTGTFAGNVTALGGNAMIAPTNVTAIMTNGYADAFVAKLNSAGMLQWLQPVAGDTDDFAYAIATDPFAGHTYMGGVITGTGPTHCVGPVPNWFGTGPGSTLLPTTPLSAFVTKVYTSGQHAWSTMFGGMGLSASADTVYGLAVDGVSNTVILATFWLPAPPAGPPARTAPSSAPCPAS